MVDQKVVGYSAVGATKLMAAGESLIEADKRSDAQR
jgi:hypothetical protein